MNQSGQTSSQPDPAMQVGWPRRRSLINLKRLLVAGILVGAVLATLTYFDEADKATEDGVVVKPGRLVETPRGEGRQLKVFAEKDSLAPNFEVTRLEGGRLQLSDLRGSPVVLKFWATWCASCLAEFPHIKELHHRYSSDGLRVLALNAGETRARAKEFADFLDAPFDWALDPGLVVSDAYKVIGFPVSVFIDREGVVRAVYVGQMDEELMESYTRAAIEAVPGSEAPFKLRLITNLGRENVVLVQKSPTRQGQLIFASRSFRCDPVYCRDDIAAALEQHFGIRDAVVDRQLEPPVLHVFFDPRRITDGEVIAVVQRALEADPDPLYEGPLQIRQESTAQGGQ